MHGSATLSRLGVLLDGEHNGILTALVLGVAYRILCNVIVSSIEAPNGRYSGHDRLSIWTSLHKVIVVVVIIIIVIIIIIIIIIIIGRYGLLKRPRKAHHTKHR